jgi:hypothetical protein
MWLALWAAAFSRVHAAVQPPPFDGGAQFMREAENYAWRAAVVAHEAAVAQDVPQVQQLAAQAGDTADRTSAALATVSGVDVQPSLAAAEALRDKAVAVLEQVKEKADHAEAEAARVAKEAAQAAVDQMWKEGDAYFASLEAKLAALAKVPVNPKADNAQKQAQPYLKAALDTQAMVAMYNLKAQNMVAGAFGKVQLAHRLATEANQAQAAGDVEMANRKMIQAHGLMVTAQLDEDQAKGIYALAREFNQVVPMYQGAGNQAAAAALALPQLGINKVRAPRARLRAHAVQSSGSPSL